MKNSTAQQILDAAEVLGLEFEQRTDYSGRGMYGSTTVGLIVDNQTDLLKAAAYAAFEIGRNGGDVDEFIAELDFSYDSLGRSTIAY